MKGFLAIAPIIASCALCLLAAAGCGENQILPPVTQRDTLRVAFQDGLQPNDSYFGTRDAVIKDGPTNAFYDGNFGTSPLDTLGIVPLGSALYERRLFLRMDLSGLAGCSAILDARLTLRIEPHVADSLVLELYGAEVPPSLPGSWVEGNGFVYEGVSWETADGTTAWTTPGGDFSYPPLDVQTVRADTAVTFELPGTVVLNWIRFPYMNNGVLIRSRYTGNGRYLLVHLRESGAAAYRPKLELAYFKSG
jgi:hypothetical protein